MAQQDSGTQKAAMLLVALGRNQAAEVIKHLPQEHVEQVMAEVSRIEKLAPQEKERVLGDFFENLPQKEQELLGGKNTAHQFLSKAFGSEKADSLLDRFGQEDNSAILNRLEKSDSKTLTSLLKEEHPQMISTILAYLSPTKAAHVLRSLPKDVQTDVARRLAHMDHTSPKAVTNLMNKLVHQVQQQEQDDSLQAGGMESLVEIFNQMSVGDERKVLDHLYQENPQLAQELEERLVTFDTLVNLSNHEMRMVLDRVPEDQVLTLAIKGASEDIRRHLLSNISRNRARTILDNLGLLGPTPLSDIEDAREKIVLVAKKLDQQGYIALRKEEDEWVE